MQDQEEKIDDGKRYLSLEKNSRIYQFLFYKESSIGEIYDILSDMRKFIFQKISEENKDKPPEEIKNE